MSDVPVQVALAQAAAAVGAIPKDDMNQDQGFKYRGIERILAAVGPALHRAGVVVMPKVIDVHREEMLRGQNRNVWRLVSLTVEYTFTGPAGDQLHAVVVGEGLDNGDKAVSKAMTMAYKVALLQALQIADADTDADATSPPEQFEPPPQPTLVRPEVAAKMVAACVRDNVSEIEQAALVHQSTGGRTSTLWELREPDEVEAWKAAKKALLAARPPADSDDPGRPM